MTALPWNLREIRPGVWKIRIYAGMTPGHKQMARTKTFRASGVNAAKKQATVEAATIMAELKEEAKGSDTVAQLVRLYLKHRGAKDSPTTIIRRTTICDRIKADLGKIPLTKLSGRQLDAWYDQLRTETKVVAGKRVPARSESTCHHYHRVLAAVLHQGERWGMLPTVNPLKRSTPPKRRRSRIPVMPSIEQLSAIMADATPGLRLAIRIAAATGLRRGELLGLRVSDLEGDQLRVERTVLEVPGKPPFIRTKLKHDKPRYITIDPDTAEAIRAYVVNAGSHSDALILSDPTDRTGRTPRRPGWLSLAWARACEAQGVECHLHDLRHLNITIQVDAGIPVGTAAERAGHETDTMVREVYNHPKKERDREAAAAIGEALKGLPK